MGQYARVGTQYDVGLYSLGEAILRDAFRAASYQFLKSVTSAEQAWEIQQSLAFIQGSGLEAAIETFGLAYRPEYLRETFFTWGTRAHRLASSSAITQAD